MPFNEIKSKQSAQTRADQIHHFQEELKLLENSDILHLTNEQHVSVANFHEKLIKQMSHSFDIDTCNKEKQLTIGMKIASFLGALALSASIFFLFYQFWGNFSTSMQIIILVLSPIFCLMATMYAANKEKTSYFAKLLAMVSFACFVLNVSMLGYIFNIIPSDKAFLVWALFAFLLAYAIDASLLLGFGIICISCFLSARAGTWSGCYWIYFGQRPENFFLPALLLFITPTIISHKNFSGFDKIYRVFGMLLIFIPILILSNWGQISHMNFDNDLIEYFYQIIGFAFSGIAIFIGIKKGWSEVINTGNVFFVILLYTKFYDWCWSWMPKYLFFFIIALTSILFLTIFKRLRNSISLQVKVS